MGKFFCFFTKRYSMAVLLLCWHLLAMGGHYHKPDRLPYIDSPKQAALFTAKPLVAKYAGLLKTDEAHINKFIKLYTFIEYWMGTPYLWGGCSKSGIDCSCFVQTLFNKVFNINIKRTSLAQFCDKDVALFTNRSQYELGDLIFFKTNIARETRNNPVTHVGFYLTNGYFVQSSSAGVNIANLNQGYWKNRTVAAGRLKESYYKKAGIAIPSGDTRSESDKMEVGEENSNFEPIPFPEEMDSLIADYADLLNVGKEKIVVPEVFDFIEKNRYAPHHITSRCPRNLANGNCLSTALFKDVFNIHFTTSNNNNFLLENTGRLPNESLASFLDVVVLKPNTKGGKTHFNGIYLYNGYFLHLQEGDLAIASLTDLAFKDYTISCYRFKEDTLKKALANIVEKRKGLKPGGKAEEAPPAKTGPTNLLKKEGSVDSLKKDIPLPAETPAPKKKKKKKPVEQPPVEVEQGDG
jgi:NlpC/P60 family